MKLPLVMIAVGLISVSSAVVLCVIGLDDLQVRGAAETEVEAETDSETNLDTESESESESKTPSDSEADSDAETGSGKESNQAPVDEEQNVNAGAFSKVLDNDQAFRNIESYLENHPHDRNRAHQYGHALIGLAEWERAESFFLSQLEDYPGDLQVWFGLGRCYEVGCRWQESAEAYSKALEINYAHVGAKNNLAWILATCPDEQIRNGSKAVALAKHAVGDKIPLNPAFMDTLAAAYAELGDFDKAIKVQQYVVRKIAGKRQAEAKQRLQLYQQHRPFHIQ